VGSVRDFFSELFSSGSQEEYNINVLFLKYLILAGVIILLVGGLAIIGAVRYRSRRRPGEPPQVTGNRTLEIIWTVLPFLAVTFFFILTIKSMRDINRPYARDSQPDIEIIAHQWWWDMRYPAYGVITANELHIPVGQNLLMRITSADVIHSWWVPALGRKMDAIPGRLNYLWIDADTAGLYDGTCSEYCGMEHAWMRILVVAEPQAAFDEWIRHQQTIPTVPADSVARAGAYFFQEATCASCHAIAGTPAQSHIGPDLTHLGSRMTLISGKYENTSENLKKWLTNPQKEKMGAHMPNFMLTDNEINALVTYLEGLK
jgi:cytochrome c oxidase subunit 2